MKKGLNTKIIIAALVIALAGALTGCAEAHVSRVWQSNESIHWHKDFNDASKKHDVAIHDWEVNTFWASCDYDGYSDFLCKVCGYEKTEVLPAGHQYTEWGYDYAEHWLFCYSCGKALSFENHWFEGNTCVTCGFVK